MGYWGGVILLIIMFMLFEDSLGKIYIDIDLIFGFDLEKCEGMCVVGLIIVIWYVVFMILFFLWVKDD